MQKFVPNMQLYKLHFILVECMIYFQFSNKYIAYKENKKKNIYIKHAIISYFIHIYKIFSKFLN